MTKEVKKKFKYFLIGLLIILFSQFLIQYSFTTWPKLYMILALLALLILTIGIRLDTSKYVSWNAFLVILTIGVTSAVILPVRYNLDENTHYFRTLQIADGHFTSQSDEPNFLMISPDFLAVTKLPMKVEGNAHLNTNLYSKEFKNLLSVKSNYKKEWTNKKNKEINNPAYYPSAIGIMMGRLISNKLYVAYYMGRIFNVLFYAILVYLGIKMSKKYKTQLFFISTLPFAVGLTSGYSYDSMYYGLTIILIAMLTNMLTSSKIKSREIWIYSVLSTLLVFCKPPVLLMIFIPLLINKEKIDSTRYKIVRWLPIIFGGLVAFIWLIQSKIISLFNITSASKDAINNVEPIEATNRLGYFIQHPLDTFFMGLRSFSDIISSSYDTLKSPFFFIGPSVSLDVINYTLIVFGFILLAVYTKIIVSKKFKIGIVMIALVITVGIFYAITGDNRVFKVGDLHIYGVQGRYHFYVFALIPLMCSDLFKKYFKENEALDVSLVITKLMYFILFLNMCVSFYAYL